MTWASKIFPDSELDGGLVASMLQPSAEDSPVVPTPTDRPLWELMMRAYEDEPGFDDGTGYAAEIEAVQGFLPTMPPEEFVDQWANEPNASMASMTESTMEWVHALLSEQARIAREGDNA